jgi:hypothetical protein
LQTPATKEESFQKFRNYNSETFEMKYEELFDALIDVVENEHRCLTLDDQKIAEILTKRFQTDICKKVVFNVRKDADVPRSNLRRWLWRHNISPIQVQKVNADPWLEGLEGSLAKEVNGNQTTAI